MIQYTVYVVILLDRDRLYKLGECSALCGASLSEIADVDEIFSSRVAVLARPEGGTILEPESCILPT